MGDRLRLGGTNILIIGDSAVGKSSLISYLKTGQFEDTIVPSIESEQQTFDLTVEGKKLTVTVQDTPGDRRYERNVFPLFQKCAIIIFVFDKTYKESFEKISYLKGIVDEHVNHLIEFILVGNKLDETDKEIVTQEDGERKCTELHMNEYFETSAKDGTNVKTLFTQAAARLEQLKIVIGSTVELKSNDKEQTRKAWCNC